MKQYILDTNVLIRFLVGDNAKQQQQAALWFKEAEQGKRHIAVAPLIIAETSFVLESFYKKKRDVIANALEVFISQRWLKVHEREVLLDCLAGYCAGMHFVDSYLASWARIMNGSVLTFDKGLAKKA